MMNQLKMLAMIVQPVCYDNDNDAYIPEMWANESLMILEESVVLANLVHRDFEDEVQNFGDVVNTRRPRKFYSSRKTDSDDVEEQDAVSDNVRVPLDQHHYKSFIINDGEGTKSFKDLVNIYLRPAIQAVGRGVERSIAGQVHRFTATGPTNRVGGLGTVTSSNIRSRIIAARQLLNNKNVPEETRYLVFGNDSEAKALETDHFSKVNESGDNSALRRAVLGDLYGFGIYAANSIPSSSTGDTEVGDVTNAASAGTTGSQAVTLTGYEVIAGEYAVVAGNDQPTYITAATTGTGDTTAITLNEALKNDISAGAALTVYPAVQVTASYAAGWSKEISVDGWTVAPAEGRQLSTGTGGTRHNYTIIESRVDPNNASNQLILLDRPLEAALSDNDDVFPGPTGEWNLAFHRDALALVTRPLAQTNNALGVLSAVADHEGLSIRVNMQYDSKKQGTRVTCDMLSGVALLDEDMAALVIG